MNESVVAVLVALLEEGGDGVLLTQLHQLTICLFQAPMRLETLGKCLKKVSDSGIHQTVSVKLSPSATNFTSAIPNVRMVDLDDPVKFADVVQLLVKAHAIDPGVITVSAGKVAKPRPNVSAKLHAELLLKLGPPEALTNPDAVTKETLKAFLK